MIAKQYLITGLFMGIIGIAMSLLFRIQLAWPEQSFAIFEVLLGKWAPEGVMDPNVYLALVTIHGTIMVFFVLTAGLSGTFNLLIPLQIGARDMASGLLNMISFWLFFLSSAIMVASLFVEAGPAAAGWTIYPPLSALPQAQPGSGMGMTFMVGFHGDFHRIIFIRVAKLYRNSNELAYKRDDHVALTVDHLGIFLSAVVIVSFLISAFSSFVVVMDEVWNCSSIRYFHSRKVLHYRIGSPVLYEHLFWFLGHPEVYIVYSASPRDNIRNYRNKC